VGGTGSKERWPCRRGLTNLWAWLAADGYGDGVFLAATGELALFRLGSSLVAMVTTSSSRPPGGHAHLRAWLASNGHGGDLFFAVAGGLAHPRAWFAADGHGGDFFFAAARRLFISPAHLRTERRAPMWGSEFTTTAATLQRKLA
jgi:hypothetical protein